jgi:hypothetical protein
VVEQVEELSAELRDDAQEREVLGEFTSQLLTPLP